MPAPERQLSLADAARVIAAAARPAADDPGHLVGIELEWLVVEGDDPSHRVSLTHVDDELVTRSLPGRGRVTFEPGGQLELSTAPSRDLGAACSAASLDVEALARRLGRRGLELVGLGLDPVRPPERMVRGPRYDAMEAYFDGFGPPGRTMMCSTAAIQVNVGTDPDAALAWRAAHAVGPLLAAIFANSPFVTAKPRGWRSTRLATWLAIDASRTSPVGGADPVAAWVEYALAARVMLIRHRDDQYAVPRPGLTLREWIDGGSPLGWPDADDVGYHLTTLFPPVRPRGWLELRMIDALPDPWWRVAAAVVAVALHPAVARDFVPRCAPLADRWFDAARHGVSQPDFAIAARRLLAATTEIAPDIGADAETLDAINEFADRYPALGRTPADDRIDEWIGTGAFLPPPRPPRERSWT